MSDIDLVTPDDFRAYLEVFHQVLAETAGQHLPEDTRGSLRHLANLPARIIGYVSETFGIAFEYLPASVTSVRVISGRDRIEDLIFRAPAKVQYGAVGFQIGGAHVTLRDSSFTDQFPFRLISDQSRVIVQNTYFAAGPRMNVPMPDIATKDAHRAWGREIHYAEIYGNRSRSTWNAALAVESAKREVILAVTDIRRASKRGEQISEFIESHRKNTILLLGDYGTEGKLRLSLIEKALRQLGYDPIQVEDLVPDIGSHDLMQKLTTLALISKFIVVDNSTPSGHLRELERCKANDRVTVVLNPQGIASSAETLGLSAVSKVIREFTYEPSDPLPQVQVASRWAETTVIELKKTLDSLYPWRHQDQPRTDFRGI
jgi:hypothetical protein